MSSQTTQIKTVGDLLDALASFDRSAPIGVGVNRIGARTLELTESVDVVTHQILTPKVARIPWLLVTT